jgi:hypothetical protein
VLFANGITFGSYYSVTAGMPAQFAKLYDLNDFQVGLCYIPAGLGSLLSATANGVFVDWNYRRICIKEGIPLEQDYKRHLFSFPIEKARLQIGIPMIVSSLRTFFLLSLSLVSLQIGRCSLASPLQYMDHSLLMDSPFGQFFSWYSSRASV